MEKACDEVRKMEILRAPTSMLEVSRALFFPRASHSGFVPEFSSNPKFGAETSLDSHFRAVVATKQKMAA